MNLSILAFAISVLPHISALTDAEYNKFSADSSYAVTSGTSGGATMYPSLTMSKTSTVITIQANHVPPHATASSYTNPITTYIGNTVNTFTIPNDPAVASSTTCLPAGTLGIAVNGVAVFSAYSRPCTDAISDEAIGFDSCDGHPQEAGTYHYHYKADCLATYSDSSAATSGVYVTTVQTEQLYGVAFDGFPIYNKWDASGNEIFNSDLDDCHGYDPGTGYRYIVNDEFPYIIGCFSGTPLEDIDCHCTNNGSSAAHALRPIMMLLLLVSVLALMV